MILDKLVQTLLETEEPTALERDIYNLLDKLIEAAKTGSCAEEQDELLSCFWSGTSKYYKEGIKAGMQLFHETLTHQEGI